MSWALFKWIWELEAPLYVGMPPAGSLNRTRPYVPTRALWGALTAELARQTSSGDQIPDYDGIGRELGANYRFTYLYPAALEAGTWRARLPAFDQGQGLVWHSEYGHTSAFGDRAFRRRLLGTRPGTAIDAGTDTAEDGSLRETECVQARWRDQRGHDAGPVALVGYVFVQTKTPKNKWPKERQILDPIETIFLGGDTRYGLGKVRRIHFDAAKDVFGAPVKLDEDAPTIKTHLVLAHTGRSDECDKTMSGALEMLSGWNRHEPDRFAGEKPLWQPGSRSANPINWSIEKNGTWKPPS